MGRSDIAILALQQLIQTIGEAARRVPEEFRVLHTEIPWPEIIGMRNIIVHRYAIVELELVWKTATHDTAELIALLEPLLPPRDQVQDETP
jgi:uncharacterized protein with HEPN domain